MLQKGRNFTLILSGFAGIALTLSMATAKAQIVLVDFNRTAAAPSGNWNSIALTSQNLAMIDSSGASTAISLSHTFVTGTGVSSIPFTGGSASWYDANAVLDGWKIGAASRKVTFSGFSEGASVTFSVIAARGSGASGTSETIQLAGATTVTIASNMAPYGTGMSTDGTTLTLFSGTVQPSSGSIDVMISGGAEATINALRLEVTPVPEPLESTLGAGAGLFLFAFLKKRHAAMRR